MSRRPRRNHLLVLKGKMATTALGDRKNITEIPHKRDVHPAKLTEWRRQLLK